MVELPYSTVVPLKWLEVLHVEGGNALGGRGGGAGVCCACLWQSERGDPAGERHAWVIKLVTFGNCLCTVQPVLAQQMDGWMEQMDGCRWMDGADGSAWTGAWHEAGLVAAVRW